MRALPADSFEYFGDTAVGKTVLPAAFGAAGAAAGGGAAVVGAGAGAAAGGGAAVVGAEAGAALAPHWVLRNSFHVCPARVPAVFAAWYLALHSFAVRAPADDVKTERQPYRKCGDRDGGRTNRHGILLSSVRVAF